MRAFGLSRGLSVALAAVVALLLSVASPAVAGALQGDLSAYYDHGFDADPGPPLADVPALKLDDCGELQMMFILNNDGESPRSSNSAAVGIDRAFEISGTLAVSLGAPDHVPKLA